MSKIPYEKYYNNLGQVAVLYSPGYGAGWFSWENEEGLLFDKEIVEHVLSGNFDAAAKYAEDKYGAYAGGASQLKIAWIYPGTQFNIHEYDGSESIEYEYDKKWITA